MAKGTRLKGDLHAANVIVDGEVEGDVEAVGKVDVRSGARVIGDIRASSLSLAAGSFYEGQVKITPPKEGRRRATPLPHSTTKSTVPTTSTFRPGPESTPLSQELGIRRRPRGLLAFAALLVVGALAALVFEYVRGRGEAQKENVEEGQETVGISVGEAVAEEIVQPDGVALVVSTPQSARPKNRVIYSTGQVNIRSGPNMSFSIVRAATQGERLAYTGEKNGWYRLDTQNGEQWIHSRWVSTKPGSEPGDSG